MLCVKEQRWLNQYFSLVIVAVCWTLSMFAVWLPWPLSSSHWKKHLCVETSSVLILEAIGRWADLMASIQHQRVTLLSSSGKGQFGYWEASGNQFFVLCSELPNLRQKPGRLSVEKVPEMEIAILKQRIWPTLLLIIKQYQCSLQFSLGLICTENWKSFLQTQKPRKWWCVFCWPFGD